MRECYPFMVLRDKRPKLQQDKMAESTYGDFGYLPFAGDCVWAFPSEEARERFIGLHGGSPHDSN